MNAPSSPLVSVLIPSRGRPGELVNAIDTLLSRAEDPECVEILCRLDSDDHDTLRAFERLCNRIPVQAVLGPRLSGWQSNHLYFNELARLATGKWLMLYNDDATMLTGFWDAKIRQARRPVLATRMRKARDQPPFGWRTRDERWFSNCFPIVSREACRAVGQFSRHRHTDVYWEWLTCDTLLQETVEIDILHTPTASIRPDAERGGGWWNDFHTDPLQNLLASDKRNLLAASITGTL